MASASAPPERTHLTLPELLSQRSKNPPRRYEQTKPVLIQSFTHHSIVDLGKEIHQRTLQRCAEEQRSLVLATQEAIRAEAARDKEEALLKAAKAAKVDQEKMVAKMNRLHERNRRAEMMKIEADLKTFALKQVQLEREAWQSKLNDAVAAKEAEWKKISEKRVEDAIDVEQDKAELALQEQKKVHEAEVAKVIEEGRHEREKLKVSIEAVKEKEKVAALEELHEKEVKNTQEKITRQKQLYDRQILALKEMTKEVEKHVDAKIDIINQLHHAKRKVEKELMETRVEFEAFIANVKPYQGEPRAEYVLPPPRSVKITEK